LVQQVVSIVAVYLGEHVAWTATNALRADLALHCLRLDMAFHKKYKPGELIERVDGDVNQLANFFSQLIIQMSSNLLLLGGVMALLFLADWRVGFSITAVLILGGFALRFFGKRATPRWQKLREADRRPLAGHEQRHARQRLGHANTHLHLCRRLWLRSSVWGQSIRAGDHDHWRRLPHLLLH
jgi:ATP-binding cassette subfamily B protein